VSATNVLLSGVVAAASPAATHTVGDDARGIVAVAVLRNGGVSVVCSSDGSVAGAAVGQVEAASGETNTEPAAEPAPTFISCARSSLDGMVVAAAVDAGSGAVLLYCGAGPTLKLFASFHVGADADDKEDESQAPAAGTTSPLLEAALPSDGKAVASQDTEGGQAQAAAGGGSSNGESNGSGDVSDEAVSSSHGSSQPTPPRPRPRATKVLVANDGAAVAVASDDGNVAVYRIDLARLAAIAGRRGDHDDGGAAPHGDSADQANMAAKDGNDGVDMAAPPTASDADIVTLAVLVPRSPELPPLRGLPADCVASVSAAQRPAGRHRGSHCVDASNSLRAEPAAAADGAGATEAVGGGDAHLPRATREPLLCFCHTGTTTWIMTSQPGSNRVVRDVVPSWPPDTDGGAPTLAGGSGAVGAATGTREWTHASAVTSLASDGGGMAAIGLASGATCRADFHWPCARSALALRATHPSPLLRLLRTAVSSPCKRRPDRAAQCRLFTSPRVCLRLLRLI
jgi:hypothetical protein